MTIEIDADAFVFDCDGVILDSNSLKSNAFAKALEGYDSKFVAEFVDWHKATGGVSRYEKFRRFFTQYVGVPDPEGQTIQAIERFAAIVFEELVGCEYINGFEGFVGQVSARQYSCSVNTGGDEAEVIRVLETRGSAHHFGRILGSPNTKRQNMVQLADEGRLGHNGIYLGDSRLDYDLACEFGLKFIFVQAKSDWEDAMVTLASTDAIVTNDLAQLILR